ncbi:hypothetical protein FVER14953_20431 [Fusarium verticillioides]|nr:hypothetical protein FVER14953_20431 [Fusarium verticillioides]
MELDAGAVIRDEDEDDLGISAIQPDIEVIVENRDDEDDLGTSAIQPDIEVIVENRDDEDDLGTSAIYC